MLARQHTACLIQRYRPERPKRTTWNHTWLEKPADVGWERCVVLDLSVLRSLTDGSTFSMTEAISSRQERGPEWALRQGLVDMHLTCSCLGGGCCISVGQRRAHLIRTARWMGAKPWPSCCIRVAKSALEASEMKKRLLSLRSSRHDTSDRAVTVTQPSPVSPHSASILSPCLLNARPMSHDGC